MDLTESATSNCSLCDRTINKNIHGFARLPCNHEFHIRCLIPACENYYSLSDIMHDTKWTNREYKKYRYISTWPARRGHSNPQIDKGVWFGNDMYNPYSENGDAHTGQPTTKYPNVPTCRNCF
jgi:hypothetical protein